MIPKEKAFELYNQFRSLVEPNRDINAKKAALIAVRYIQSEWLNEPDRIAKQKFWLDVENEINNIL